MSAYEKNEIAIVLSPHQDDAVISVGNLLHKNYSDVRILNIFTKSASHILGAREEGVNTISNIRRQEDEAVARRYGFVFTDAGFKDSELRGIAWDNPYSPSDGDLQKDITDYIQGYTGKLTSINNIDYYIPAAFGLHPDHYAVLKAGLSSYAINRLDRKEDRIFVYGEQPYYLEPQSVGHSGQAILTRSERIDIPYILADKKSMLDLYPSQLTPERVDMLSKIGSEYIWQIPKLNLGHFALSSLIIEKQSNLLFGSKEWLSCVEKSYSNNNRNFIELSVKNEKGGTVNIPIVIDDHDILNVGKVKFARHAGAFGTDYMGFDGIEKYDNCALNQLESILEKKGIDVLWLSNIKEDNTLLCTLESQPKHNSEIFSGLSSYRTVCDNNGYSNWVSSLQPFQRKKIRQICRKEEDLFKYGIEDKQNFTFDIKIAGKESIDTFFNLQDQRASQLQSLDSLKNNVRYRSLIEMSAGKGQLSVSEIKNKQTVISSLLLSIDEEAKCIAILAQGFSNDWSRFSPSFINMRNLIQYAHENNFRYVDFLRGDESYKKYFTNQEIQSFKYIKPLSSVGIDKWVTIEKYIKEYNE